MSESKELTLPERAKLALQPASNEMQLAALASQSKSIVEITNPAGYQQAHAARMTLKNQRIAIEKVGKAAREDATAFSKAVIAEQQRLIGLIEPEEQRLEAIQKAWDDARAAEKKAREDAERARVGESQKRLAKLESLPELYTSALPSAQIMEAVQLLEEPPTFDFQEFAERATGLRQKALISLRKAHVEALEREEREEAERAAREAKATQEAAEKAERDRQDAERRAAEEARLAEVRKRLDAEQAEQRRVAGIQERIAELRGCQSLTASNDPALIREHISDLQKIPVDESFAEFRESAARTKQEGLDRLSAILTAAEAHHAAQEELRRQQEALERAQQEQLERQAEIDRKTREAEQAENDRKARIQAELNRIAQEAANQRAAEERRARMRQQIAAAAAEDIARAAAAEFGVEPELVAARIAEISHEDWLALAGDRVAA